MIVTFIVVTYGILITVTVVKSVSQWSSNGNVSFKTCVTVHVVLKSNDTMAVSSCSENSVQYMPSDGFLGIQIVQNSISAGALPRTPLGELTMLPRPLVD